MTSNASTARSIGIFTLLAIVLLLAGFVAFNSSDWFADDVKFEMVFPGEITGLSVGSPVTFRGAKIGEVHKIDFEFNESAEEVMILVIAKFKQPRRGYLSEQDYDSFFQQQIARGLKAQLVVGSLVTGSMQIKLEYQPDIPSEAISSYRGYPVIPTVPTEFQLLEQSFQSIAEVLDEMPVEDIIANVRGLTDSLDKLANSQEVKQTVEDLAESTEHIKNILAEFDQQKEAIIGHWQQTVDQTGNMANSLEHTSEKVAEFVSVGQATLGNVDKVLISVNSAVKTLQNTVKPDSELGVTVIRTLDSLDKSATQIRELSLSLQQNPEALISGRQ